MNTGSLAVDTQDRSGYTDMFEIGSLIDLDLIDPNSLRKHCIKNARRRH